MARSAALVIACRSASADDASASARPLIALQPLLDRAHLEPGVHLGAPGRRRAVGQPCFAVLARGGDPPDGTARGADSLVALVSPGGIAV